MLSLREYSDSKRHFSSIETRRLLIDFTKVEEMDHAYTDPTMNG